MLCQWGVQFAAWVMMYVKNLPMIEDFQLNTALQTKRPQDEKYGQVNWPKPKLESLKERVNKPPQLLANTLFSAQTLLSTVSPS